MEWRCACKISGTQPRQTDRRKRVELGARKRGAGSLCAGFGFVGGGGGFGCLALVVSIIEHASWLYSDDNNNNNTQKEQTNERTRKEKL